MERERVPEKTSTLGDLLEEEALKEEAVEKEELTTFAEEISEIEEVLKEANEAEEAVGPIAPGLTKELASIGMIPPPEAREMLDIFEEEECGGGQIGPVPPIVPPLSIRVEEFRAGVWEHVRPNAQNLSEYNVSGHSQRIRVRVFRGEVPVAAVEYC